MDNSTWKKIGRKFADCWGMPHRWTRTWANRGARRRTFESTRDLIDQVHEEDLRGDWDHDDTTCSVCYEDYYGHPPENPEDYKYGKRYRIVKDPG